MDSISTPTLVTSGDLALIALANGYAKKIELTSYGRYLEVYGRIDVGVGYPIRGFWSVRMRRFMLELPLVQTGLWRLGDSYVAVNKSVEIVVNGRAVLSKPNICGHDDEFSGHSDRRVNVHIIGSITWPNHGVKYVAFRCGDWKLWYEDELFASRFAYDKSNRHAFVDGLPIETYDIFVKRGRIVKTLKNPTCEEYIEAVRKLFRKDVSCVYQ